MHSTDDVNNFKLEENLNEDLPESLPIMTNPPAPPKPGESPKAISNVLNNKEQIPEIVDSNDLSGSQKQSLINDLISTPTVDIIKISEFINTPSKLIIDQLQRKPFKGKEDEIPLIVQELIELELKIQELQNLHRDKNQMISIKHQELHFLQYESLKSKNEKQRKLTEFQTENKTLQEKVRINTHKYEKIHDIRALQHEENITELKNQIDTEEQSFNKLLKMKEIIIKAHTENQLIHLKQKDLFENNFIEISKEIRIQKENEKLNLNNIHNTNIKTESDKISKFKDTVKYDEMSQTKIYDYKKIQAQNLIKNIKKQIQLLEKNQKISEHLLKIILDTETMFAEEKITLKNRTIEFVKMQLQKMEKEKKKEINNCKINLKEKLAIRHHEEKYQRKDLKKQLIRKQNDMKRIKTHLHLSIANLKKLVKSKQKIHDKRMKDIKREFKTLEHSYKVTLDLKKENLKNNNVEGRSQIQVLQTAIQRSTDNLKKQKSIILEDVKHEMSKHSDKVNKLTEEKQKMMNRCKYELKEMDKHFHQITKQDLTKQNFNRKKLFQYYYTSINKEIQFEHQIIEKQIECWNKWNSQFEIRSDILEKRKEKYIDDLNKSEEKMKQEHQNTMELKELMFDFKKISIVEETKEIEEKLENIKHSYEEQILWLEQNLETANNTIQIFKESGIEIKK